MPIYKAKSTAKGVRYFKDKRFIKKTEIPAEIDVDNMEIDKDYPDTFERTKGGFKNCLFCGAENCKYTRLLNAQILYLCEEHYYSENMGKVAQQVRQLQEV